MKIRLLAAVYVLLFAHGAQSQILCGELYDPSAGLRRVEIDPLNQLIQADQALHRNQPQKAIQFAMINIRLNPYDMNAATVIAKAFIQLGRSQDAIPFLERIAADKTSPIHLLETLINIYLKQNNHPKLIVALKRKLDRIGEDPKTLSLLLKSQIKGNQLGEEGAEATLNRLLKVEDSMIFRVSSQVQLALAKGQNAQAVAMIEGFENKYPAQADIVLSGQKATAQKRMGDVEGAIATYHRILVDKPRDSLSLSQLAHLYIYQREFSRALPLLLQVIELEPNNPMVRWNRVISLYALRDIEKLQYLANKTKHGNISFLIQSLLYTHFGRYAEAIETISQTTHVPFYSNQVKAYIYTKWGKFDLAAKELMALIQGSTKADYFALAALFNITKKPEVKMNTEDYQAFFENEFRKLSPDEIALVMNIAAGKDWSFSSLSTEMNADPAYSSAFWLNFLD